MLSINEFNKIKQPGQRRCAICGEIKSLDEFEKDKRKAEGRGHRCKSCISLKRKTYDKTPKRREAKRRYKQKWKASQPSRNTPTNTSINRMGRTGGFIYVFKWREFYKIGRAKNPQTRTNILNASLPFKGEIVCTIPTNNMSSAEIHLHYLYLQLRRGGEWFELSDNDIESLCSIKFIQVNADEVVTVLTK